MADQAEPRGRRHDNEQRLNASNPAGQRVSAQRDPAQHFVAPAESFGSFGPLPDYPVDALPTTPFTFASTPGAAPAYPHTPDTPVQPSPAPYVDVSLHGYPSVPNNASRPPYAPGGMEPQQATPLKTKKPILFPLTRKAPVLLHIFGMLLYSLIMILGIMGCALILLRSYVNNGSVYFNLDGSPNGLSILITAVIFLVLVPACSLFCGVFFGSWRGLIVSLISLAGGLLVSHLTDYRIGSPYTSYQNYTLYASLPITALVVGLMYERRIFASWWKSMFTMLLGVAILVIWAAVFVYFNNAVAANLDILAASSHTTEQNYLATLAVTLGCGSLLAIPLLGLLFAGIEGILHSIIAGTQQAH